MGNITDTFVKSVTQKINQQHTLTLPQEVLDVDPIRDEVELFVGHTIEIETLSDAIANCVKGVYKRIIIHGQGGVGKTSLTSIIGEACNKADLGYKVIRLDKSSYVYGFDYCYCEIVYILCLYIFGINREEARELTSVKINQKYHNLLNLIGSKPDKITKNEVIEEALRGNIIDKVDDQSHIKLIEELMKKLSAHKLGLIFDDFEMLWYEENKVVLNAIKPLFKLRDVFSILIMHTDTLTLLVNSQDELIKDTTFVEILPMTITELKDLIWKRLMFYVKDIEKFDGITPNYEKDLLPFKEDAINIVAEATEGNPLLFIKVLKDTIATANAKNVPFVDIDIAKEVIDKRTSMPETLSIREKQLIEFIKTKKEVSIDDVKMMQGKSRITAFFTLDDLYKKGLLEKARRGRVIHYFFAKGRIK